MQITQSFTALAIAFLAAVSSVTSQSTAQDTIDTGIANVTLNLEATKIIPNLINSSSLQLQGLLVQTFGNQNVSLGQLTPVSDVANVPTWSIQYSSQANTSGLFQSNMYTVMTLDPGSASDTPRNIVRHYLANNVTLTSTNGQLVNSSKPIAGWFSPAPPAGSGVHRYTTLVFRQPSNFSLPQNLENRDEQIDTNFNLADYISQTHLGPIVAANFFLAENSNTAASTTVSGIASTTAVPAASVSAAASSVSKSLASAYASGTSTQGTNGAGAMISSVPSAHIVYAALSTIAFVFIGTFTL